MSGPPDRAYNEHRRFGLDPVKGDTRGTPTVEWGNGTVRPVLDIGWLGRNSKYVQNITYEPSHSTNFDTTLRAKGEHPDRGPFEFSVGFRDRESMRSWVGNTRTKWSHVQIADHTRDGTAQYAERPSEMNSFSSGANEGDRQ